MAKLLSLYFYLGIMAISSLCVYAIDEAPSVGHLSSLANEVKASSDVVIAKFTNVKAIPAGDMNGQAFHGHITVMQSIQGSLSGDLEVGFRVIPVGKDKEVEPNLNDTYIIIMSRPGAILKLLLATNANVTKIKALVAAAPARK